MTLTRNGTSRRTSIWRAMLPPRPAIRINHLIEGIRVAIACTGPVIAGEILHQPVLAWAGIAAFWICLADPGGPLRARFAAMATLTVIGALTVAVAIWAVATNMWLALALAFIWAFVCSFVAIYGGAATGVGRLITVVYLVVIGVFPGGLADLAPAVIDYVIGCVWAMILVLVLWPTHPYQPGRTALAASYDALAVFVEDIVRLVRQDGAARPSGRIAGASSWDINATEHRSRVRREIETTRQTVAVLGRARPGLRPTLERQLLLAEYADRHFAALIAFSDLLESRLMQSGMTSPEGAIAADIRPVLVEPLACLAKLFRHLAETIPQDRHGVSPRRQAELAAINAQLVEKTRQAHELLQQRAAAGDSSLAIFEHLLDTLLTCAEGAQGVLLGTQLAVSGTPLPTARERASLGSWLAGLAAEAHANLTWASVSFRHALRVSITVTIALYLTLAFQFGHGYWLTMTTVLILQPYVGSTWQTAIQRMVGSVAGAVLAAFLVTIITDPLMTSIAVFPLSIGTSMFRALDYGLYSFFLTPQFVLIAGLANPEQADASLAGLRALDSVLGGMLAVAASFLLWPNREARQLPLQIANAITANLTYLQQVAAAKSRSQGGAQGEPQVDMAAVDASRRQAGLGSNNAEAALQRWLGEPGHERLPVEAVMALITAARRLAGTATTLWLSPAAFPADNQAEIRRRIDWVTEALGAIAEAVRHRQPPPTLPPAPPLADLGLGTDTDGALLANVLTRLYLQIEIMQEALQRLAAAREN